MSQIPYVNALGDALEQHARSALGAHPRRRRLLRTRVLVIAAILVAGAVASAGAIFGGSVNTDLASNEVICVDRAGNSTGTVSAAGDPRRACAGAQASGLPASRLVACVGGSGPNGPYVTVYPDRRPGECARRGQAPLPPSYASAQGRVSALGKALTAVEDSADCVPVEDFTARARGILTVLGWSGWTVRVEHEGGPCGALQEAGAGVPSIRSSLEAGQQRLVVWARAPRSVIAGERATWKSLDLASGHRCLTAPALEQLASREAASHKLSSAFAVTREPRFVGVGNGLQERYEAGCAVMAGVELVPSTARLDITVYSRAGGAAAAQGAKPAAGDFHPRP